MPVEPFAIAGRRIGPDAPCFVIAEAGVNHDGDTARAHALVDAAARAGADAVKFQTFDPELLASPKAPKAEYQIARTGGRESQLEMLRRLVLPRAAHRELKVHAEQAGLLFLSTPFDEPSADFLIELGVPALKLGSGEVTNHPLLEHVARSGLPVILSTGMSELQEIEAAVRCIGAAGSPPLALLHCTSAYPAPPEAANLRALKTLRERFALPVGYSDHSLGLTVALAAVALGACILEKHLTLDRSLPGPDHVASLEPGEFVQLVSALRAIRAALGDGRKIVQACEENTRGVARRSLFAARDLAQGDPLRVGDLVAARPGAGLSPARLRGLLGRRLARPVARGTMLAEDDVA